MGNKWNNTRERLARPLVCASGPIKVRKPCIADKDCIHCGGNPVYEWSGTEWLLLTRCACTGTPVEPAAPPNPVGWRQCGTCIPPAPEPQSCEDCGGLPLYQWDGAAWQLVSACDCEETATEPAIPGTHNGQTACGTCVTPPPECECANDHFDVTVIQWSDGDCNLCSTFSPTPVTLSLQTGQCWYKSGPLTLCSVDYYFRLDIDATWAVLGFYRSSDDQLQATWRITTAAWQCGTVDDSWNFVSSPTGGPCNWFGTNNVKVQA